MARTLEEISENLKVDEYIQSIQDLENALKKETQEAIDTGAFDEKQDSMNQLIEDTRKDMQEKLDNAKKDFEDAIKNLPEEQKETLKADFESKESAIKECIDAGTSYKDVVTLNTDKLKNGEDIRNLDDIYSKSENLTDKYVEPENPENIPDMDAELKAEATRLREELEQAKRETETLERAYYDKIYSDLETKLGQSVDRNNATKVLRQQLKDDLAKMKKEFEESKAAIEAKREEVDDKLLGQEEKLADAQGELKKLRGEEFVKKFEKGQKSKKKELEKLETSKAKEKDPEKLKELRAKIKTLKKEIKDEKSAFEQTEAGKEYKRVTNLVKGRALVIKKTQKELKGIEESKETLENDYEKAIEGAKEACRENVELIKADKPTFFQKFKAFLQRNFGKDARQEEAKRIKGAIEFVENGIGNMVKGAKGYAKNQADKVKEFFKEKKRERIRQRNNKLREQITEERAKGQKFHAGPEPNPGR